MTRRERSTPPPAAPSAITVRQARVEDIPALAVIKGAGSEALHRDRLRDAESGDVQYLALLDGSEVIGFVQLVFRRPAHWSDAGDTRRLPQIVDLQVRGDRRGQGCGTLFLREIERAASRAGCAEIYLCVEPVDNPRALALYLRLGYRQIQPEPYASVWEFTDSGGRVHRGEDWVVDMVKDL